MKFQNKTQNGQKLNNYHGVYRENKVTSCKNKVTEKWNNKKKILRSFGQCSEGNITKYFNKKSWLKYIVKDGDDIKKVVMVKSEWDSKKEQWNAV